MPRVLIAEDESRLRAYFVDLVQEVWPEVQVVAEVGDGAAALQAFEASAPEVAFLDVRMPELSGIEVARVLAGQCQIVFITAHDDAAVAAFETGAIDYVLKPVTRERLAQTVERLRSRLSSSLPLEQLIARFAQVEPKKSLRWIQATTGRSIEFVDVHDVAFFKAEDKYTTVGLAAKELLVRMSLKELLSQLDAERFWQIHRSTIVNIGFIDRVQRNELGEVEVHLKGRSETFSVSRAFRSRFRHY